MTASEMKMKIYWMLHNEWRKGMDKLPELQEDDAKWNEQFSKCTALSDAMRMVLDVEEDTSNG